ncbi:hypothetical protein LL946_10530 [Knoellia locipacati]|uniref:hypothetical protein n=1 Tax=Knoellia locipacati TaxID=882824 RepID=UPI0038517858
MTHGSLGHRPAQIDDVTERVYAHSQCCQVGSFLSAQRFGIDPPQGLSGVFDQKVGTVQFELDLGTDCVGGPAQLLDLLQCVTGGHRVASSVTGSACPVRAFRVGQLGRGMRDTDVKFRNQPMGCTDSEPRLVQRLLHLSGLRRELLIHHDGRPLHASGRI